MRAKLALLLVSVLLPLGAFELAIRLEILEPQGYVISDAWWQEHWLRDREGGNPREFVELDPLLGWIPAPGLDGLEYEGVRIHTNQAHMRGRAPAPRPDAGGRRIVAVGDSYTFGQCVEDDETWPAALERELSGTRVLNLGVMGYGQDQALLRLRRDGLPYAPEMVVFGFHPSNMRRNLLSFRDYAKPRFRPTPGGLELENVPVPPPSTYDTVWPPRLWNWIRMARDAVRARQPEFHEQMRELSWTIVRRMAREADAAGARLLVVYLPHPVNLEGEGRFGWRPLADFCDREEPETLRCVDPVPRLRELLPSPKARREAFACHFSAPVQAAVARAVAEAVREETRADGGG